MKKYLKKFSMVFLILLAIMGIQSIQNGTVANAATIGQPLLQPEDGWRRYDDSDSRIKYIGNGWIKDPPNEKCYNSTCIHIDPRAYSNSKIQFRFQGTKLRIISFYNYNSLKEVKISIDGVEEQYNSYCSLTNENYQTLLYEKQNLNNSIHTVEISNGLLDNNWLYLGLDAIDIDSTGQLLPYDYQPIVSSGITLNKTTDNLQVGQTDNLVATITPDNATNKNVTWTSSDTSVVEVDPTSGKVTARKAGTATITATTMDGSKLSATCAVTVTDINSNRAILTITFSDNTTKTYDLSKAELDGFLNWIKSKGAEQEYYVIENKPVGGNITNTDYIFYNKIKYFNVQEYKTN